MPPIKDDTTNLWQLQSVTYSECAVPDSKPFTQVYNLIIESRCKSTAIREDGPWGKRCKINLEDAYSAFRAISMAVIQALFPDCLRKGAPASALLS